MKVRLGTLEVSEQNRALIGLELGLTRPATREEIRHWVFCRTRSLDETIVDKTPLRPRLLSLDELTRQGHIETNKWYKSDTNRAKYNRFIELVEHAFTKEEDDSE